MRSSLLITGLLGLLSACGGGPQTATTTPVEPAEQTAVAAPLAGQQEPATDHRRQDNPAAVARLFWAHLADRDYDAAVALASYPFDLDAHNGCIDAAEQLRAAFDADPLPPDVELVVGGVHLVSATMDLAGLDEHWHERIRRWTGAEASCLGDPPANGAAPEIHYFLVDFTVNGDEVGSLTRVRCSGGVCTVAGTEN